MKLVICGANARCLGVLARDFCFESGAFEISAFLDNDKLKQGSKVKAGYYYIDGRKLFLNIEDTIIDSVENVFSYEWDYIIIVSFAYEAIRKQLVSYGVDNEKIIMYKKYIESGLSAVPDLGLSGSSFDALLAAKHISGCEFYNHVYRLFEVSRIVFKNGYRLKVLESVLSAVNGAVKGEVFEVCGVTLPPEIFVRNPSLFIYEMADILFDNCYEDISNMEYTEGPYELGNIKVDDNSIVFDIGANFGLFSALAATKNPNGKIYAFEPVSETREVLGKVTDLYNNVSIVPFGLADKEMNYKVDVSGYENNPGSISIMSDNTSDACEEISVISLDAYVKREGIKKIDYIKADIEGAERLMLLGAQNVLKEMAPKLVICTYHYKEDAQLLSFLIKNANEKYSIEYAYGKLYAEVR